MRLMIGLLALSVLSPSIATAASERRSPARKKASTPAATRERGGPELFGGFSYARSGEAGLKGWELSGSLPVRRRLRLGVDLARDSGSFAGADLGQTTLLVGPVMSWQYRKLRPFARFHLGMLRASTKVEIPTGEISESDTALAVLLGGGADYPLARRWSARAQAELLFTRSGGESDTGPRLALGLVYRFGR